MLFRTAYYILAESKNMVQLSSRHKARPRHKTKMLPKMLQLFQLLHNIYADQQFSKDGGTTVRKEKWKA